MSTTNGTHPLSTPTSAHPTALGMAAAVAGDLAGKANDLRELLELADRVERSGPRVVAVLDASRALVELDRLQAQVEDLLDMIVTKPGVHEARDRQRDERAR